MFSWKCPEYLYVVSYPVCPSFSRNINVCIFIPADDSRKLNIVSLKNIMLSAIDTFARHFVLEFLNDPKSRDEYQSYVDSSSLTIPSDQIDEKCSSTEALQS